MGETLCVCAFVSACVRACARVCFMYQTFVMQNDAFPLNDYLRPELESLVVVVFSNPLLLL